MSVLERIKDWFKRKPDGKAAEYFAEPSNWVGVGRSTNVLALAFFTDIRKGARSGILGVRFIGDREYFYDVARSVGTDMLASASKGRFVWENFRRKGIKGRREP